MLDEDWSDSEELLLRTAASLWRSSGYEISVGHAAGYLNDTQFALWQAMIQAARTHHIPAGYR